MQLLHISNNIPPPDPCHLTGAIFGCCWLALATVVPWEAWLRGLPRFQGSFVHNTLHANLYEFISTVFDYTSQSSFEFNRSISFARLSFFFAFTLSLPVISHCNMDPIRTNGMLHYL